MQEIKKELPKLSVVTPNYNDGKTLNMLIESVFDQDYPNIEMIVVDDGSTDNSMSILEKAQKKHKNLKVISSRHKGACAARNIGAKEATGDFLSFLPADAVLYPGVVRTWMNHLIENPEYDFLYGGYRFVDEETRRTVHDYLSEPFDQYMLKIANYIDGSFPLKRELFEKMGGWDVGIKSLQDWDFWLNAVVKCGAKGFYLPEVFFETTMPHKGGLSDDSHNNWEARTAQIKAKYGIPEKEMCVTSKGAEFHGKKMAKILDADFKFSPDFKPHSYNLIYLLGFYASIGDQCASVFNNHRGLRVVHWIGSDVWQMQQMSTQTKRMFVDWIKNNVDVNLTEFKFTQKELEEEGIKSRILPLPPTKVNKVLPLPEKFTVAIYLPQVNKDFYSPIVKTENGDVNVIDEISKKCRDVNFKIFGDYTQTGVRGNVEYMGRLNEVEMDKLIADSSCLLRLVKHDGLSITVEEFITAGRRIITNIPTIKGAYEVELNLESVMKAIDTIKAIKEPDTKNAKYWQQQLSHAKYKKFFDDLLDLDIKKYWEDRSYSWNEIQEDTVFDEETVLKQIEKVDHESILEIGCGNGNWAKRLPCKEYLGTDFSVNQVKSAQKNAPSKKFKVADVLELGKIGKKYDLIFGYTCLMHIKPEDMEKAVEELKKVGKRIMFIEPIKADNRGGMRILNPLLIKEIEKGKVLFHPKNQFTHDYGKYFNIKKRITLGDRELCIADL